MAELEICRHHDQLKMQYGFLADPDKELWENLNDYYGSMTINNILVGRPTNMACHNVCNDIKAPVGVEHLLGLEPSI